MVSPEPSGVPGTLSVDSVGWSALLASLAESAASKIAQRIHQRSQLSNNFAHLGATFFAVN